MQSFWETHCLNSVVASCTGLVSSTHIQKMCMDLFILYVCSLLWRTYKQRMRQNKQNHYFNHFGQTMAQIVFLFIASGLRAFLVSKKQLCMFVTIFKYIYIYLDIYTYLLSIFLKYGQYKNLLFVSPYFPQKTRMQCFSLRPFYFLPFREEEST